MGMFDRMIRDGIRRGISNAVGNAVGSAVQKAVEPKAAELVNKAAGQLDSASNSGTRQDINTSGGLEGAMANLERAAQGYATEAAKNMKICPSCQKPTTADKRFCPECGTALPEQTVAQSAVCINCGKQNSIGIKFCQDCGTKLPAAIQEEQAAADRNAAVMAAWDEKLSHYPKWNCGGTDYAFDDYDTYMTFSARFKDNDYVARQSVEQYRQILLHSGFRQAGQYPSMEHLYKKVEGICYHVDTEHCFEGDSDCPTIGFDNSEPYGGFDYVKSEPKKKASFMDLFGL